MDGFEEYGRSLPLGLMGFLDEGGLLEDGGFFNGGGFLLWLLRKLIPTTIIASGMKKYMICPTPFTLNPISGEGYISVPHKNS